MDLRVWILMAGSLWFGPYRWIVFGRDLFHVCLQVMPLFQRMVWTFLPGAYVR